MSSNIHSFTIIEPFIRHINYLRLFSSDQICRLADVEGVGVGVWQHSSRPQPPHTSAESLARGARICEYLIRISSLHVFKHAHYCDDGLCHLSVSNVKKNRMSIEQLWDVHLAIREQLLLIMHIARLMSTRRTYESPSNQEVLPLT